MLNVQNLTYRYTTQQILMGVNCQLGAGKIGLLVGRNGSGKSTFLRCIAGWTQPEDGNVDINGISPRQHERDFRRQVILVPDVPDFYDELTAWEHLQFISQLHGLTSWETLAGHLLEQFDLTAHRHTFPFTFSRGMRYKLSLCIALLVRPPLLLLDEPFSPLDTPTQNNLWHIIKQYVADGKAVLFSSHGFSSEWQPDVVFRLHKGTMDTIPPSSVQTLTELLSDDP